MKIRYALRAQRDIASVISYIEQSSPTGADRVRTSLDATFSLIGQHPHVGLRAGTDLYVKTVADYPYKIFYRLRGDFVDIVHVRHAARRPW
jgi:plasmid stabilization system protein ParE